MVLIYKKYIVFYVKKIICLIFIISSCGNVIKRAVITSQFSTLCFCTNDCSVKILARYNNQTIFKRLCINNCQNQYIFTDFVFDNIISQSVMVNLTLTDQNYGFPIPEAILNFNQNL